MGANFPFHQQEPKALGFSSERLSRITPWLESYIDEGKLPFAQVVVLRRGQIAYSKLYGLRDIEKKSQAIGDGIYRIYSMSKLVTTVAAMSLFEEGSLMLDDQLSWYLPEFANCQVYKSGEFGAMTLVPQESPITIRQLMTHTSGLTYGAFDPSPVGRAMRGAKVDFGNLEEKLDVMVKRLDGIPLCFQPGTEWRYGVSTDVLGRVIEIVAGQSLEAVFQERIFGPLKMKSTFFALPEHQIEKFCSLYTRTNSDPLKKLEDGQNSRFCRPVNMHSGGGGLLSSTADYLKFIEMIRLGGVYESERVLGRKTVDLMLMNHLPGDMASMGQVTFSEMPMAGIGFGLGGAVLLDPVKAQILSSEGEFTWGGMASTAFWIDRSEELSVIFMTQLIPSSSYPVRRELRILVYQSLID
ncbi:MAG: serine hydrolase [Rhodospirillaceae bacterium]|nr:serine hydrolase [Rhodospirillaceae bacterium]|tara:strand:+ start:451 stop:1683 length:1233 start_codon:yes stop_codon:yes gene_type:complete